MDVDPKGIGVGRLSLGAQSKCMDEGLFPRFHLLGDDFCQETLMQCRECHAENPENYTVCSNCGQRRIDEPLPSSQPPALASVGSVSENETYLGNRLLYQDLDRALSGEVDPALMGQFFVRAVIAGLIAFLVAVPLSVFIWATGAKGFATFILVFGPMLVFFATFFVPFREGLSEWEILIDGKAAAADSAYAAIYATMAQRQFPVRTSTRRFSSAGDPSVNNFLIVQDGTSILYVSVFAYGTGLYIGWSMWHKRSPFRMMLRFLYDTFGGIFGRQQDFAGVLGSQRIRALRESVHSAVRESVDAVNNNLQVSVTATFGHDIPVERIDLGSSSPPSPVRARP
jgi:hypothetical protein